MTKSSNKPAFSKDDGSRSAFSKNNNSKLTSRKNNSNDKVNRFGIGENVMEHNKKLGKLCRSKKLSKLGKSKSEKMFKSQNLIRSGKKLSKSGNSTNSHVMETKPKFLYCNARIALNYLWLAFTKALILLYFDLEYHI